MSVVSRVVAISPRVNVDHVDHEHLHLSHGDIAATSMIVSWATKRKVIHPFIMIGLEERNLFHLKKWNILALNKRYKFGPNYVSRYYHHIEMLKLVEGTRYFYRVGGMYELDTKVFWSDEHSFATPKALQTNFAILGDLGQTEFSRMTLGSVLKHYKSDNVGGSIDSMLIAGDLSYADCSQDEWDHWFRMIDDSTLGPSVPIMVAAGNHDVEGPEACGEEMTQSRFDAYQTRFFMPNRPQAALIGNTFYSFEVGLAHVAVLCPYVEYEEGSAQYRWFEKDVAALDRELTPWVIVMAHEPFYNSNLAHKDGNQKMRKIYEPLFQKHNVDIMVAGHVHSYERTWPVYNAKRTKGGTVYFNVGDGGNREGLASVFSDPRPPWSAFRQANYGFGKLSLSHTEAVWTWYRDETNMFDRVKLMKKYEFGHRTLQLN